MSDTAATRPTDDDRSTGASRDSTSRADGAGAPAKTSVAAVFSLVFGLIALLAALTGLLAPVAVLFGLIGLVLGIVGMKAGKKPLTTGRGSPSADW